MSLEFNLRSKVYWKRMASGIFLGFCSAIGAFIFIVLVHLGQKVFLPYDFNNWAPFTGPWWIVALMTGAGLLVGVIHRYTSAQQLDAFKALDEGCLDPEPVPPSLLTSFISLLGGFSLGPEVPCGFLAAGLATWFSNKWGMDPDTTRINVASSVSGAYGGIFSSPFAMILILLESKHRQSVQFYGTLFIAGMAALVGFIIFYSLQGFNYASLLGLLTPPKYDLRPWHLGVSILLGILAVPAALFFVVLLKISGRIMEPLQEKPILRSTLGGLFLGLLAVVLPTTIGLGSNQMPLVTYQAAEIGVVLLLIFALAKMLALSSALSSGFIGGPIFPLLFVGSCLGAALNQIFPQLPLGLALGCMIVAIPAAIVPIPLSLAAIVIIVIGLPPVNILPILVAALVSFTITRGLIMGGKELEEA